MKLFVFIALIASAIILHEAGHYFTAKRNGVHIVEFGIFYPPRLMTLFEMGGTKFTLNLIPLGGFVRPQIDEEDVGSIQNATPFKKIKIYSAGVLVNFALAIFCYFVFFSTTPVPDVNGGVIVDDVINGLPAYIAGVQPGDKLLSMNGTEIHDFQTVKNITSEMGGKDIDLVVLRNEEQIRLTLKPLQSPLGGDYRIGISMAHPQKRLSIVSAFTTALETFRNHIYQTISLPFAKRDSTTEMDNTEKGDGDVVGIVGLYHVFLDESSGPAPISSTLLFFASINVALGVFNLLPIPGLDGGRIALTIPEFFNVGIPDVVLVTITSVSIGFILIFGLYINLREVITMLFST